MDKRAKEKKEREILETHPKKMQVKKENRALIVAFLIFGIILVAFFAGYFFLESKKSFEYRGVKFNTIQEGKITFYNTQVPIYSLQGKKLVDYNFYLRNDPRELEKYNFQEKVLNVKKFLVLNYSSDVDCSGYGIIALKNVINLYELIGTKVVKDENASCDSNGNYMRFDIRVSNETGIKKIGEDCYLLKVSNCEILPVTEKMMVETFVKMKEANAQIISSKNLTVTK